MSLTSVSWLRTSAEAPGFAPRAVFSHSTTDPSDRRAAPCHAGHPKSDNIAQFFSKPGRGTAPPELHRSIFLKHCKAIRRATCEAACAFRNQQAPVTADGCKAECQVSILRSSSPPSPKNLKEHIFELPALDLLRVNSRLKVQGFLALGSRASFSVHGFRFECAYQ